MTIIINLDKVKGDKITHHVASQLRDTVIYVTNCHIVGERILLVTDNDYLDHDEIHTLMDIVMIYAAQRFTFSGVEVDTEDRWSRGRDGDPELHVVSRLAGVYRIEE